MSEKTDNVTSGAMVPVNSNVAVAGSASKFDIAAILSGEFDINSLPRAEQLELMREIMEAEANLEIISLPMVNSIDIVGHPINIHDAVHKTIIDNASGEEKLCVNFLCENAGERFTAGDPNTPVEIESGEFFTVLKGANAFNDTYVMRFRKLRGVAIMPLLGYNFVEDARWRKVGNNAVVLRKITGAVPKIASKAKA